MTPVAEPSGRSATARSSRRRNRRVDGCSAAFVATAVALVVAAVIAVVCIRGTTEELMPSGEGVVHLG
ncbi:hypothetical protein [Cellulomonas sp. NS3]|uniref:hypothetical protein n=1 Tax=Cellulomonas sp. NS3 TaxID=2973977 RepID=UPI002161ED88|nr:hypothetical protein [Cellulomonas sp. NS3]